MCAVTLLSRFLLCVIACALLASCPDLPLGAADGGQATSSAGPGSVWVVDSPQGGRLYLCGTIHILRKQDYPLAPAYEVAYADSQRLVFELPPGSATSEMVERMRKAGSYPAGTALDQSIPAETWKQVKEWAASRSMRADVLRTYRPWFVALTISAIEYAALGAEPGQGVDNYFEARAAKDGKPAEGLETVDFQLRLFSQLEDHQQLDLLEQTLAEAKTLPDEFDRLIRAWKKGDLDTLYEMLYREAERFPELMELFLENRNKSWIDRLEGFLRKGDHVMVLVGTGHFAGQKGVIQLLREKGYRVEHLTGR